jgi:chemotaxis protein histidine kinase CheA
MAIEKTIVIKTDTQSATKDIKNLEKAVEGVNKEVKETTGSTEAMGGVLDNVTGGAVSKFKGLKGSLKGVITSFKTLRVAIISTGIGALVIGIVALSAAFKGSEDGQNKFAKIMTVIGAAVGNLVDLLADLGEGIINAFTNPVETIKGFADTIKTFVVDKITGTIDSIGLLGSAIKKVFSGDFKGALEDTKKGFKGLVDNSPYGIIRDGIKSATDATKEFIKEQKRELGQAAAVADMRAKADKIERKLIVDRSKLESEIANLRLKSRQEEEFSAAERKQALLDAQVLEDQLLDKETEFLELRRDAQILENTFSRSNKENLTKEAEAIAAVNRQQAARANTARQVQREVNTISKQIEAENKQKDNEEKARIKELDDFKKTLRDAEAVSEQQKRDLELIKIQEHYDNLILQAEENNIKTDELEAARDEAKRLKQKEFDDKDLAAQKATADASLQIQKLELDAKQTALNGYASALSSISGIIGQETEAGKGLAIASSLVNTYASIAGQLKAFSGVPIPGYAIAQAIATGVVGFANVKKIASVKIPKTQGSGGAVSGSVTGSGGSAPAPPSFNIVGATETSQLADAIGGQTQQPVQAYVVANDVTTAQSLENNIVEGATLG